MKRNEDRDAVRDAISHRDEDLSVQFPSYSDDYWISAGFRKKCTRKGTHFIVARALREKAWPATTRRSTRPKFALGTFKGKRDVSITEEAILGPAFAKESLRWEILGIKQPPSPRVRSNVRRTLKIPSGPSFIFQRPKLPPPPNHELWGQRAIYPAKAPYCTGCLGDVSMRLPLSLRWRQNERFVIEHNGRHRSMYRLDHELKIRDHICPIYAIT